MKHHSSLWGGVLWLSILCAGLIFRVAMPWGHAHQGDAVIIAKMASDIATGVEFPLVYYGQNYMGSIEAWITAPLFALTGPTWWGISFAPVLVSTLGVIPFYLLGSAIQGARTGYIAASLWAITPYVATIYNITPRGCYPEVVCGVTFLLWYATQKWKGEKFGAAGAFAAGLISGLLLWTSPLSEPYVATLAFFVFLSLRRGACGVEIAGGAAGLATGLVPYVMSKSFIPDQGVTAIELSGFAKHLEGLYWGVRATYIPVDEMNAPYIVALAAAAVAVIVAITAGQLVVMTIGRTIAMRDKPRSPALPVAVFTVVFLVMFLVNSKAALAETRYTLPLQTVFIIGAASAADRLWRVFRPAGITLVVFILCANFSSNYFNYSEGVRYYRGNMEYFRSLASWIAGVGARSVVWNDYNLMEQVTYQTLVMGKPVNGMESAGARRLRTTLKVESDPDPAFVIPAGEHYDNFTSFIKSCCGGVFKTRTNGRLYLVSGIRPDTRPVASIPPSAWRLKDDKKALGDRRMSTTLATDDSFTVELAKPRSLARVRVIFGNRRPGSIRIKVSLDGRTWDSVSGYNHPSYIFPAGPRVYLRSRWNPERDFEEWNFPETTARYVRFEIGNPSSVYDIHEMFLYEARDSHYAKVSMERIHEAVTKRDTRILAANRWMCANLTLRPDRRYEVIQPSLRSMDPRLDVSRWKIAPGFAAVVDKADAPELENRLETSKVEFSTTDLGDYDLFVFDSDSGDAWWTGFTLIGY